MFISDQHTEEIKMAVVAKVLFYVIGTSISLRGYHPLYHIQSFLDPISVTFFRTEDGSSRFLRNIGYFLPDCMVSYARK
jgi:hypothetical protein